MIHVKTPTWNTHQKEIWAQPSHYIHQIYTWIGTAKIHVKNTCGKQVKQNQVAFFTWYPSDIHVNRHTINPRETLHVEYTWKCMPYTNNPHVKCNVDYTWKQKKAQTSIDIHQIYTWIGRTRPINHVKNTRGKHVKQKRVALSTWYPSDIHVNGYTINPRETIHVEYTWKCTLNIHMRNATWNTCVKIRLKLHLISMCKSTPIIHIIISYIWRNPRGIHLNI